MSDRQTISTFIVNVESEASDGEVLDALAKLGLRVDAEYGLIRLDPHGLQRVARVIATEEQLERARSSMPFTYYPDLTIFKPRR